MAEVLQIDPNTLQPQVFSPKDDAIIPSFEIDSLFNPEESKIEFFIYDLNNNLLTADYNYRNWRTIDDPSLVQTGEISTMEVKPGEDVVQYGFDTGELNTIYNFTNYQLDSSPDNLYYISDISADRTELRLKTNILEGAQIESSFEEFELNVLDADFFDEFYINFGNNNLFIAVNAQLDKTEEDTSILIKLYEPLPTQYQTKDEVYVVTKVAESVGYQVSFDEVIEVLDDLTYLRGPNTALDLNNQTNNSSEYQNYDELESTPLSSSFYQLKQIANQKGINLNVDYTSFSNFIYFSSAKTRLENFYYKAQLIETYQTSQSLIENYNNTPTTQMSSSTGVYRSKIENIIKNFDGYEYFLYYNSESKAFPKQNTQEPYTLYSYSSSQAKDWLGSSNEGSAYYGGELLSGSDYDNSNQNNLFYTVPEFIREDTDNNPYELFINMMGQHFDNLWLYTKQVTEKLDRDNRVAYGISKDLVADTLKSLGTKLYGGGFAVEDIYTNFLGYNDSGSLLPPTGSELITNYVTASGGPVPLDNAHKELYKRLYNNLPYLLKKKGTIEGIRNLITIYGIPQTILRISEFGGKDKYNSNDYDYTYDRYSYALKTQMSASALIPWKPLKNSTANTTAYVDVDYFKPLYIIDVGGDTPEGYNFPNSIQFRFNAGGIPTNTRYSQSIFVKKNPTIEATADSQSFDFGVFLTYDPSGLASGSYSGSIQNPNKKYGNLELVISGSGGYQSGSINLPFFDEGWWSGMVTRNLPSGSQTGTYTLYAGNNIYNGPDGDKVGFTGSVALTATDNQFWRNYNASSSGTDGIWFGGYISGSHAGGRILAPIDTKFSGSLQEFRYATHILGNGVFNDFVMNPESIEGPSTDGSGSSFNTIAFRAAFGNELNNISSTSSNYHTSSLTSIHPAVTGSEIFPSFVFSSSAGYTSSSLYRVIWEEGNLTGSYADKHTETYYLDQPVAGLKNRITDKIKIENLIVTGSTLSNQISIQQTPIISQSYMRDVNLLEVAFSPQNEINDDIIQSFGYFNLGEYIGDPRYISSSNKTYTDLDVLQRDYFKKYYKKYNIFDYVRLIKYFDNSLFKMIKDYVPARTAVNTGIVIKQHLLERNRQRPAQLNYTTPEYSQSIEVGTFSGGAGGSVNQYNTTSFDQSYTQSIFGLSGSVIEIHDSQEEFYNGEYSGSYALVTTQSLNPDNTYKSTGVGTVDIPSGSVNLPFDLSPYDVLDNNVSESRKDDLIQVVDYLTDATFPSNYTAILSGSAEKAQVNKSFFTTKANIQSRYLGNELTSADYNNYTAGDVSYGTTAVIDKHPTYFAHFKSSIPTMEALGELEFEIDYLIPSDANVPENISSVGEIPGLLKVGGNGDYQYIVSNNFEKGRNTGIDFDDNEITYYANEFIASTFDINTSAGFYPLFPISGNFQGNFTIPWGNLETQTYPITTAGSEYRVVASNQTDSTGNNIRKFYWGKNVGASYAGTINDQIRNFLFFNSTGNSGSLFYITQISSSLTQSQANHIIKTGSGASAPPRPFIMTGSGQLYLGGTGNPVLGIPPLSLIHINNALASSSGRIGPFDMNNIPSLNYWGNNASRYAKEYSPTNQTITHPDGGFKIYEDIPFQIMRGDEISITDTGSNERIFTFLSGGISLSTSTSGAACTFPVHPDPVGSAISPKSQFTIRRKFDQDNKIRISIPNINKITQPTIEYGINIVGGKDSFSNPGLVPTGSLFQMGTKLKSNGGYLIPDDFTQDQKDKVGKIIAVLKGNNVFD